MNSIQVQKYEIEIVITIDDQFRSLENMFEKEIMTYRTLKAKGHLLIWLVLVYHLQGNW